MDSALPLIDALDPPLNTAYNYVVSIKLTYLKSKQASHNRFESFTWFEAEACQQRETVLWQEQVEFVSE